MSDCRMGQGEKLGLRCPFACQNIEWSLSDESYSRRYQDLDQQKTIWT
jgi:hypothetical protein